ncbi:MAG: DUF2341 domain-containing protein [Robiginitomaculum sp.]
MNLYTSADFPASYTFSPTGDDIRIFTSDDTTSIDFFVSSWDSGMRTATIYVRLPTMAEETTQTIYIYLGDNALEAAGNATLVFPDVGVRLRSRVSTVDPTSAATARTAFETATVDVNNSVRSSISNINNQALGGDFVDFAWCISAVLNVTAATTGNWGFRYGGDFGRGGHLYVRGQVLEEAWNDDLWWGGSLLIQMKRSLGVLISLLVGIDMKPLGLKVAVMELLQVFRPVRQEVHGKTCRHQITTYERRNVSRQR